MHAWDTIVIGSGPGGLTAGAALARAGQRVLVLEQHAMPGGSCRTVSLAGFRFSPGVHGVGGVGPGGALRRIVEGLGIGADLELCEVNPEALEHILIDEERFDVPKGEARWLARLCERFPHERAGLLRYFRALDDVRAAARRVARRRSVPAVLALPVSEPSLLGWGLRTHGALLDATIHDPLLRGVLAARSSGHGVSPTRVPVPLYAAMTAGADDGAHYPRGGAGRIPLALIKALRRGGGQIRLRARVRRILVERDRVAGVELGSGEQIRAPNVLADADRCGELLPPPYGRRVRAFFRREEPRAGTIAVLAAVDLDLRRLGYGSGNTWWYKGADVAAIHARQERALPGDEVLGLFLAIPTLKDPGLRSDGLHTIEMLTVVPREPFLRSRGPDEERLREALGDKLCAAAENVIPGLSRALRFRAVLTPGPDDGLGPPPRLALFAPLAERRVDGLHLCRASTRGHGVAGVAMAGLHAAMRVLHAASVEELLGPEDGSIRIHPAERPQDWLARAPWLAEQQV